VNTIGGLRVLGLGWIHPRILSVRTHGCKRICPAMREPHPANGMRECSDILKVMTMRLRSLGFEKVTVVFEQPPAT